MYQFLTGPVLWLTFIIFIGGLTAKLIYLFLLSRSKDSVLYNHAHLGWGFRSVFMWLIPLGSVSMRNQPVFTLVGFLFHITLQVSADLHPSFQYYCEHHNSENLLMDTSLSSPH